MDLIVRFEKDCLARGLTKHTVQTYRSSIKTFLRRFPDPREVNLENLGEHLSDLKDLGLQGSTLKGHFSALSSFYEYLSFAKILDINSIPMFTRRYLFRIKTSGDMRQIISIQEMQQLISMARNIREMAMLMVLAKTGIRKGELLDLKAEDVDLKRSILRIPPKPKRSNRYAFIDFELGSILSEYLSWRSKLAKSPWLWITKRGGRVHRDYIGNLVADLGSQLGLHDPHGPLSMRLSPHCFRHWFTTHLFRAGMRETFIKWLRGDSLRTEAWQWYNHIDPEEVRAEYLRCMPKLLLGGVSQMQAETWNCYRGSC